MYPSGVGPSYREFVLRGLTAIVHRGCEPDVPRRLTWTDEAQLSNLRPARLSRLVKAVDLRGIPIPARRTREEG